ncbi:Kelch motif family protein [Trichomonas vaginalis G3]|uniref:Kelch motif family protein n=1 Tax=Trichomonas vaginalis (strain ATCC PRA-98 / G3) TaxID=412133 RepID=A2DYL6_TRIV3|nr:nitrile biosynthetic process [Trichomonas vaginalis G3]EAY14551.1 Kelch motif family protein [Trichomonas vaginalis G3]KAI5529281.1 nitrile biosynthetic process [Trichomonas vaginalis G3]|eukprot:XP_001326774.1 Kelch motif family protein [Trichomonas vaginalis G3]
MGQDQSTSDNVEGDFLIDGGAPENYVRMTSDRDGVVPFYHEAEQKTHIGDYGYAAKWSVISGQGVSPLSRGGHFTVYVKELNRVYIGYGSNQKGELFGDCWYLDINTLTWHFFQLSDDIVSPRTGARATLAGSKIVVYGGYKDRQYLEDLHTIDIYTGKVARVNTSGDTPGPRSAVLIAYYNKNLFVWGGYNGVWPTTLHILNTETMIWQSIDPNISGRTAIPYGKIGETYYGYGCSKSGGFVVFDAIQKSLKVIKPQGMAPRSDVMNAGMCSVDNYLFYFGGKYDENYSNVYVYDVERNTFFILPIAPDDETVSLADGEVNSEGYLMLPRRHSFTLFYNDKRRQMMACLGLPEQDVVNINVLSISDALSVIHLQSDLVRMFDVKKY